MSTTILGVHTVTISKRGGSTHVAKLTQEGKSGVQIRSQEEQLASQLAHLASLHHASEYSRMKFGPKGSPSTYVPLCIYMPDHFRKLQEQQAVRATEKAWWKAQEPHTNVPMKEVSQDTWHSLGEKCPTLSRPTSSRDLQEDLLNAMSSPLTIENRATPTLPSDCRVKTSETHPIILSAIIPPEVLQLVVSHLSRSRDHLPVVFDVPPSLYLHILVAQHPLAVNIPSAKPNYASAPVNLRPITSTNPRVPFHLTKPPGFVNLLWSQAFWRKAIGSSHPDVTKSVKTNVPKSANSTPSQLPKVSRSTSFKGWRQGSKRTASGASIPGTDLKAQPSEPQHVHKPVSDRASQPSFSLEFPAPSPQVFSQQVNGDQTHPESTLESDEKLMLGNLFLSSCPGKKVRLDGPNRGRSAVCRDLALDLRRIRGSGVRCIVWYDTSPYREALPLIGEYVSSFLDDEELEFLGAPWPEYSHIAEEAGLDILRIPTPEGLAPLDAQVLDSHLTRLIKSYTLKGMHVLVHCRGGVGRAGLFACCWVIKLGLCGWLEREPGHEHLTSPEQILDPGSHVGDAHGVRRDTLHLVERSLSVVRRQRSPKAVETFEQVKFIMDFVDHLRRLQGTEDDP